MGAFDRYRRGGREGQYEMGLLRTPGLLATLVRGYRFDVLPADNTLDLNITNAPYLGDLYGTGRAVQLTPWTRPNINGYTHYPGDFSPDWSAIDDIAYAPGGDGALSFDYVRDFRTRPIIRSDSWIGDETRGFTFGTPVVVTHGSTLVVETEFGLAAGMVVEPGSTVILSRQADVTLLRGGILTLRAGATLVIEGNLSLEGLVSQHPGAVVERRTGGTISVSF